MRILHVDHSPVFGGAERSILELARAQRARGTDARIAVGRPGSLRCGLARGAVTGDRPPVAAFVSSIPRPARVLPVWPSARSPGLLAVARLRKPSGVPAGRPPGSHSEGPARRDRCVCRVGRARRVASSRRCAAQADLRTAWVSPLRAPNMLSPCRRGCATTIGKRACCHAAASLILCRAASTRRTFEDIPTPWLDGTRDPVLGYVGRLADWKAPHLLIDAAERLADLPA